jgi:hypothetical protein
VTNDDGVIYICESCRQRIDPAASDVVRYIERVQSADEWLDGNGCYFHRRHRPNNLNPNYRLATV